VTPEGDPNHSAAAGDSAGVGAAAAAGDGGVAATHRYKRLLSRADLNSVLSHQCSCE
jgi:hypothetical protein